LDWAKAGVFRAAGAMKSKTRTNSMFGV